MTDSTTALPGTPRGATRLIVTPDDLQVHTSYFETDVRTAMARGLKEYLEQLSIDWPGGRQSKFARVAHTWSESEVPAEYPSAAIYSSEPGTYEASRLTPNTELLATGVPIRITSEFAQLFIVEIWSTDPKERMALVKMLEDAFTPVDWMYGFRLELPHYYNTRATFEHNSMGYMDTSEDVQRRQRKGVFLVMGTCAVIRSGFDPATGRLTAPADFRVTWDITDDPADQTLHPGGAITASSPRADPRSSGGTIAATGRGSASPAVGSGVQVGTGED